MRLQLVEIEIGEVILDYRDKRKAILRMSFITEKNLLNEHKQKITLKFEKLIILAVWLFDRGHVRSSFFALF